MTQSFIYTSAETPRASFPLGGIGTGSIGLSASGRLIDWQIFNRPNKGGFNGYSHFAVKAERDGTVLDTRICHGRSSSALRATTSEWESAPGARHWQDFPISAIARWMAASRWRPSPIRTPALPSA
jgi:uncharacterized protein (DUF608 family)